MKKKGFLFYLLAIIFGIIIVLSIAGFIIELLFSFGILETDIANIRHVGVISFILSIGFIVSGIILFIYFIKLNKKSLLWWHTFMGFMFLGNVYKIFRPSYFSANFSYYFFVSFALIILIWISVFYYLGKKINRGGSKDLN